MSGYGCCSQRILRHGGLASPCPLWSSQRRWSGEAAAIRARLHANRARLKFLASLRDDETTSKFLKLLPTSARAAITSAEYVLLPAVRPRRRIKNGSSGTGLWPSSILAGCAAQCRRGRARKSGTTRIAVAVCSQHPRTATKDIMHQPMLMVKLVQAQGGAALVPLGSGHAVVHGTVTPVMVG